MGFQEEFLHFLKLTLVHDTIPIPLFFTILFFLYTSINIDIPFSFYYGASLSLKKHLIFDILSLLNDENVPAGILSLIQEEYLHKLNLLYDAIDLLETPMDTNYIIIYINLIISVINHYPDEIDITSIYDLIQALEELSEFFDTSEYLDQIIEFTECSKKNEPLLLTFYRENFHKLELY